MLSWWLVETHGKVSEQRTRVEPLAVDLEGKRLPTLERKGDTLFTWPAASPRLAMEDRERLLREHLEPMLQRDLQHRGLVPESGGYSSKLIGWVEVVP